ncbi:Hypothetical protein C943_04504 [Mariniradius saccharolyticus AK6]|uniref:DUF4199 domain-containing protein n=1 Tax=Mariniradius saccharolyticus AK6 TaxID=1239962 RepID=M7X889_9BACT|nr:DUF4199 domain-containing protein [Mariniradius saccharolyticus]EMS33625.1 Hypothetical protein C943_04504 [Mariniradius saccharolyticus AK6]
MKKYSIELKWALAFAGMSLVWMALERMVGLHDTHIDKHAVYTNFIAIPAITVYVLALLDKRKNYYGGKMTYMEGFVAGMVVTLIVTIISPLTQLITSSIITPYYFENAIQYAVSNDKSTLAAAEDYFNLKSYIIQGLIGAPIMGLITTAIVAFFTKNSK